MKRMRRNHAGAIPFFMMGTVRVLVLALTSIAPLAVAQSLDDTWTVSVNGQSVQVGADGHFHIPNISAADQFGSDGLGEFPDFLSDDFFRLTGISTAGGSTRYVYSAPFRLYQGRVLRVGQFVFTDTPPPVPVSLVVTSDQPVLTQLGQQTQVRVLAALANGVTNDVTPSAAFTTYRLSNRTIARITPDGLLTALAKGMVFVTAVNQGATAVAQLDISPQDLLTTVIGFVFNPDGTGASGLTVTIAGQASTAVTDANGRFNIAGVATGFGPLNLLVQGLVMGNRLVATAERVAAIPGGLSDAGILILHPARQSTGAPVAAGASHVVALKQDGTLWTWGANASGQLGDGTTETRPRPIQVGSDTDWLAVAAGEQHTLALKRNGTLWGWGSSGVGELGLGFSTSARSPTPIGTNSNWVSIACGGRHSVALRADGTLWLTGRNAYGQLGDGSTSPRLGFAQLGAGTNWFQIAAGTEHTLALQTDRSLWAWGANFSRQIGDGTSTPNKVTPVRIGVATDWLALAGGREHSLGLKVDGSLWSWGSSFYGQAGDEIGATRSIPTRLGTASDWLAIAAGGQHSLAVKTNGTLWAWGWNQLGQLGDGTLGNSITNAIASGTNVAWAACAGGTSFSVALAADGTLWSWGDNEVGQLARGHTSSRPDPQQVGNSSDWSTVVAGRWSTAALKTNGTLWTWGYNYLGELGNGTRIGNPYPSAIGASTDWAQLSLQESHILALKTNGELWAWGYNGDGQLGTGSFQPDQLTPIRLGTASNWTSCAAGQTHSIACRADGTLWTWGLNNSGQLGIGNTVGSRGTPGLAGTNTDWLIVGLGAAHTLALKTNGTLWAWGNNARGQLGDGTNSTVGRPSPAQVGADSNWRTATGGYLFTLALRTDGSLWAWGENVWGQLGIATNANQLNLNQYSPRQVGSDSNWAQMDAGHDHSAGVKTDGSLWTWGRNLDGQLGDGTTDFRNMPIRIGSGALWRQVATGESHTVAVRADGTLWAWGSNRLGQLGDPEPFSPAVVSADSNWGWPAP
jgi:alpha-tubulin suppressor-like RCC1 family protein